MAQQPNIELDPSDLPRTDLDTSPARRWSTKDKPGVIAVPADVPRGGSFGSPGPDTGWALRIIRHAGGDFDANLQYVLAALMAARAASYGRAPVPEDLAVAKLLCGMGEGLPLQLSARRRRWVQAVAHEPAKGRGAVAEVGPEQLRMKPDELREALITGL